MALWMVQAGRGEIKMGKAIKKSMLFFVMTLLLCTAGGYSFQSGNALTGAIWTFLGLCFLFFGVVNTYQTWKDGKNKN